MKREDIITIRQPKHDVDPQFPERWSPRAMNGDSILSGELMTLFEAARWAPSSNNNQSWRFIYGFRDTMHWDTLFSLLSKGNQVWCVNAAVLILIISKTTFDQSGKFSRTHSFDTGAAWENLALQGSHMGLVVHGMQGFDYELARQACAVPEEFDIEAMAAIGHPGPADILPDDLVVREKPSTRKSLDELIFEGGFPS